jgi:class 3 adenylate cyclase
MESLTKHLLPYVGRDAFLETMKARGALPEERRRLGEVELVCVVTHLHNFESLVAQLSLRELADVMNKFYAAVVDAILPVEGSVNELVGASVVAHFNVLHKVEDARIIEGAMNAFCGARAAIDELGARIGVGICRGIAIVGGFGTESRLTFTAFGPSAICAQHLAEKSESLNFCDEFATHFSRPQIPEEAWISIEPHYKPEQ